MLRAPEHLLIRGRQVRHDLVEERVRIAPRLLDERLQEGGQGFLGLRRRLELVQVQLIHTGEEVEVRIVGGCGPDDDADAGNASPEQGRAGERVRAAAGRAHDCEPLDPQVVGDPGDVAGGIDDPSARLRV